MSRLVSSGATVTVLALVALFAVAPTVGSGSGSGSGSAAAAQSALDRPASVADVQTLVAPQEVAMPEVNRDSFTVIRGSADFGGGGTNYDWAELVLEYGGWPVTDNNVTVIARWMRQENYTKTWWNRNNPLNNGWGSGGGSGLGSYPSLVVAAKNAAAGLNTHPGYIHIRESFSADASTDVTERAIWASPWASSHYANGSHWSSAEVPVVTAPADAW